MDASNAKYDSYDLAMDDGEAIGEVFAIPDLWGKSRLTQEFESSSSLFISQLHLDDNDLQLPDLNAQLITHDDGFFTIPDLSFEAQDKSASPHVSTTSTATDTNIPEETGPEKDGDVWLFEHGEPLRHPVHRSWEAFQEPAFEEPCTSYITEAAPRILDAALADDRDLFHIGPQHHLVIETPIYTSALLALALGRSSLFFTWTEEQNSFVPTVDALRLSGYTGEIVEGHAVLFMKCGNLTRRLQSFVDKTYARSTTPGRIALADAVATLLATLQAHLNVSVYSIQSILQLQAIFIPAESLLSSFFDIVHKLQSSKEDEEMLSQLFQETQRLEHTSESMKEILLEVLARVSRPFLEFVGEWIGTQNETNLTMEKSGAGRSFVKTENRYWVDEQGMEMQEPDFVLESALVPSFFSIEEGQTMFETGRSLRFLRAHHPNHPLARPDVVASAKPPILDWKVSWDCIQQVEARALAYEKDLITAIAQYSHVANSGDAAQSHTVVKEDDGYKLEFFGKPEEEMESLFLASVGNLGQPPEHDLDTNNLTNLLVSILAESREAVNAESPMFAPPISLMPLLSFKPIIAAQARVVNSTSMKLFFKEHNLRDHLLIQRQFHLLGNGVFSSRLSHALFDPELDTAERKAGVARTGGIVGLRLGGRDAWPPASSELRLALMGVLTESYTFTEGHRAKQSGGYLDRKSELPGDLSFAVRDMTDEEIENCVDPNSLEALDFLRLSYKPPAPLDTVITPMCLFKYDQLFKLLLRVVRMLFVVSQLFRDATDRTSYWQGIDPIAQRFRIETHHFVSCISSYFFDVGINATWRIFEQKLDEIEAKINTDGNSAVLGQHEGLDKLRDYHERVVDRIMFALLLRKRQQPVMKLLEEIFTLILKFAKHSRGRALGEVRKVGTDGEVKEMYLHYRKKVEVFITVCRALSEKKGYGEKRAETAEYPEAGGLFDSEELVEDNTIIQLLARLEMSSYYSTRVRV